MFSLTKNSIHIWEIDINTHNIEIAKQYICMLSKYEQSNMYKFKFFKDYSRYLISHVAMRLLISKYSKVKPEQLIYNYSKNGKPWIPESIYFNLSHSHKKVLIGLYKKEIGIDIEYKKNIDSYYDIEALVCTEEEKSYIKSGNRKNRFYEIWTRKEALLKGIGIGLHEDMKYISTVKNSYYYKNHIWQIAKVKSNPDYIAHIAYKNNNTISNLNYFVWDFKKHEEQISRSCMLIDPNY